MDGGSWHCTGGRDQDHPKEKKSKKAKWLSEGALQIAVNRRELKGKGVSTYPLPTSILGAGEMII